jgi:hypothetical protein
MAFITNLLPVSQLMLATLTVTTIALCPSPSGDVLLIPLTATASARLPALVLRGDASLIARGPINGSLVVRGKDVRIGTLASAGILAIAARGIGCGSVAGSDAA